MSQFLRKGYKRGGEFLAKKPVASFIVLLLLLFLVIFLGHTLRAPKIEEPLAQRVAQKSAVYSATSERFLETPVILKRNSVTDVVALAPGIVSSIPVIPGQKVGPATTLVVMTNDYNSGSQGLQTAIAKNNLRLNQELESLDKSIAEKQRRLIKKDDALTDTNENIALQNLSKSRLSSKVSLANSELSALLAERSDAVLKPKALTSGSVQSVKVRVGDYVAPGQKLVTIYNPFGSTTLETTLSGELAPFVDMTATAKLTLTDGSMHSITPTYFSPSEDTLGLFTIGFVLPPELADQISYGSSLTLKLPLRFEQGGTILLPLDSVFQNTSEASVLVLDAENGQAVSQAVTLGSVRGNFVEVTSGLAKDARIILSRSVVSGDTVTEISE